MIKAILPDYVRELALQHANNDNTRSAKEVVERAELYVKFLKGETTNEL